MAHVDRMVAVAGDQVGCSAEDQVGLPSTIAEQLGMSSSTMAVDLVGLAAAELAAVELQPAAELAVAELAAELVELQPAVELAAEV
jgi:hypothetical protein